VGVSYMSKEGFLKLEKELNHLMKVKRKEIAAKLEFARGLGDLKENAEYDAAKEEQAMLERKIGELSAKLASAQIMDNLDIDPTKAYIGATVKLLDVATGEEVEYHLVSDAEADVFENKISVTSPIGKGLLGHAVDEVVEIQIPAGSIKYKIIGITR